MSTLKVNNLQVGQDGTAANNYTLYQPASPDGTVRLGYGVAGSVTDILTLKNSRLGIGTNNPEEDLHIASNSPYILLDDIDNSQKWKLKGTAWFAIEDTTSGVDRLRITSAGNLGVGNDGSFPIYTGTNDRTLFLGTGSEDSAIQIHSGTSNYGGLYFGDATSGSNRYRGYIEFKHGTSDDFLRFGTAATEKLRITSAGLVGIGEDNPGSKLDVKGSAANTVDIRLRNTESNAQMSLYAFGGTAATGSHFNNRIAMMSWSNTEGIDIITNGTGDNDFRVYTGGYGTNSERFRITSAGDMGLGTSSPTSDGGTTFEIYDATTPTLRLNDGGQYKALFQLRGNDLEIRSSSGNMEFFTGNADGASSTERLRITSGGGTIISNAGTFPTSTNETLSIQGEGHNGHGTSNTRSVVSIIGALTSNSSAAGIWIGARTNDNTAVIGTRTASGNLAFETYSGGWGERLRITSGGDVGIGEDSPADRLVVQKTNASGDVGVRIKNDTLTDGDSTNPTTASLYLNTSTSDFNTFYIQTRRSDNNTHFGYSNPRDANHTPNLVITSDGKVGVGGLTSPGALLHLRDSNNTTKGAAQLKISKGIGSGAAPTSVSRADSYIHLGGSEWGSGANGLYIMGLGYTNGETGTGLPAYIGFKETSTSGYTLGDLTFGTRPNTDGTNVGRERMRITSKGVRQYPCANDSSFGYQGNYQQLSGKKQLTGSGNFTDIVVHGHSCSYLFQYHLLENDNNSLGGGPGTAFLHVRYGAGGYSNHVHHVAGMNGGSLNSPEIVYVNSGSKLTFRASWSGSNPVFLYWHLSGCGNTLLTAL